MNIPEPTRPSQSAHADDQPSPSEEIEEVASLARHAAGGALGALDVGPAVLLGLLVCPPLMILVVVVVVALVAATLLVALIAAVRSTPYLLVRHFRGHRGGHASPLVHRLRRGGRAVPALTPPRIVADARSIDPGR
jgi:hypothetical protein